MRIPYGTTGLELSRDVTGAEVLESAIGTLKAEGSEDDIVRKAMAEPIGSPKLSELAKGKKTATIIISDHTRPVPSKHILPFMLAELREGNPDIDITLLIATGFHRPTTHEELVNKVGEKIANEEKFVCHDSRDAASNVEIGVLPSGAKLVIDKVAAETDLLVAEGFIRAPLLRRLLRRPQERPPRCVRPGHRAGQPLLQVHRLPCARTGILEGNPLHIDMVAAAKLAKLQYIVNVVIDEEKHVAAAFAGDPFQAHETGCAFLKGFCKVKPEKKGDIVITSNGGAPLDQNMYQSVKGLTAAEAAAAPGAVLIISTRCNDGTGGDSFYHALADCDTLEHLMERILATPMDKTDPDQWEYQILCRMMLKHRIIFVSEPAMQKTIEEMKLEYAPDLDTALDRAREAKGPDAHLVIIPNGISVIVEP